MLKRARSIFLSPTRGAVVSALVVAVVALPPLRQVGLANRSAASTETADPEAMESRNSNAFAQILDEVRVSAADFMFVKSERYLHSGIAYAPHLDAEAMARSGEVRAEDTAGENKGKSVRDQDQDQDQDQERKHQHQQRGRAEDESTLEGLHKALASQTLGQEGAEVGSRGIAPGKALPEEEEPGADEKPIRTLIRTEKEDFRGFLGNLEREIKPWQDPKKQHVNASGAELLPWYRLMTLSNPRFVRGYRVGATLLSNEGHSDKALEFLNEGIQANETNPELFQLYLSKAMILIRVSRKRDQMHPVEALEVASQGLERALLHRPEHGETGKIKKGLLWTPDHEEDFVFLARFVPMLLESMGRFGEARQAADRAVSLAPCDAVLKRIADRLANGQSPYVVGVH